MAQTIDREMIRRYDISGPRYTSYPTAVEFHDGVTEEQHRAWLKAGDPSTPVSLYVHIPFCHDLCFFCGCHKFVTRNQEKVRGYIDDLHKEIALVSDLVAPDREVRQLHWGGGTPTYLSQGQIAEIMLSLGENFRLLDDDSGEYSIEIDPRHADRRTIAHLRELGFNRVSLGVQDFDAQVQATVNRIQSREETRAVVRAARRNGFNSVSVDLIYGLPYQTAERFRPTVDEVIDMAPDRISIFNYAHLPQRFKAQRAIPAEHLPQAEEKLAILEDVIERLTEADWVHVGMDHFAKADDELARALEAGTMQRGFQGYSTHAECDLVGVGASAISLLPGGYVQNTPSLRDHHDALASDRLPTARGVALTPDDRVRRDIIMALMCSGEVAPEGIARRHGLDLPFTAELEALAPMAEDELVEIDDGVIRVLPRGRLLVRNIAMVFDAYVKADRPGSFSKAI